MKMTSAYANKMLKKLNDDKEYLLSKESSGVTYTAALDEEPVIPDYDYEQTSKELAEIDAKIVAIKHAVNVSNCTNKIHVNGQMMTVDQILVRMAQLNRRQSTLDRMRKMRETERLNGGFGAKNASPEYRYINFDLSVVKNDYESVVREIAELQIALDKYNQTVEFDVEV